MSHPFLSLSYTELTKLIASRAPRSTRRRVKKFLRVHGEHMEQLFLCSAFKILQQQIQDGFKALQGMRGLDVPEIPYLEIPREFVRFFHCKMVAAICTVMACKLGMSVRRTSELAASGACHDLGHGLFGHTSERMLQAIFADHKHHEVLTKEIVLSNKELYGVFTKLRISAYAVARIINEEGRSGGVQRVSDTLGWTACDSLMARFFGVANATVENALAYIGSVISSIVDVRRDRVLVVTSSAPIQKLVNTRTLMFRDLYRSQMSEQAQLTMTTFMGYAFKNGMLTREDIYSAELHEHDLVRKLAGLASEVQGHVGQWLCDLLALPTTLVLPKGRWETRTFADDDSAQAWLDELAPHVREFAILGPKQNGRKLEKTYEVCLPTGEQLTIGPDPSVIQTAKELDVPFVLTPTFTPSS